MSLNQGKQQFDIGIINLQTPQAISESFQQDFAKTYGKKLWRIQNLYKINSKYTGVHSFRFRNIQRTIAKDFWEQSAIRYFVLKHRQALVSTLFLLYWLDECIFTNNFVAGVLAHKWESLKILFNIIRFAYDNMPTNCKPKLSQDSASQLVFENGSKIFVSLEIRSIGLNALHISEWCFCQDDLVIASMNSVGPQGHITGESTANGVGNHGYNIYQDGKRGLNRFKVRFIPWWDNEFYHIPLNGIPEIMPTEEERKLPVKLSSEQLLFRRESKRNYGHLFDQEVAENDDSCFLTSGGAYFNNRKIHTLFKSSKDHIQNVKPYLLKDDFIAWENPSKNCFYVAGADTAEGIRYGDYSVLKIINVTERREAARFRARVGVDKFAQICNEYGRMFSNALLAIERNNHGHAVLEWLKNAYRYPNLYQETQQDLKVLGIPNREPKYGWETTRLTKTKMLDMLKIGVEGNYDDDENHFVPEILWLDEIFLQECLTFIQQDDRLQAVEGKYDDTVMATGIAFQMYMRFSKNIKRSSDIGDAFGIITGLPRESASF